MSQQHKDMKKDGKWQMFTGKARELWGDFTDDEVLQFHGKYDQAIGYLKNKYGKTADSLEAWWKDEEKKGE